MKNNLLLLILVLAISTSLLILAAGQFSFWEDETYIAAQAEKQPDALLQDMPWDNHPILPLITFSAGLVVWLYRDWIAFFVDPGFPDFALLNLFACA